MGAAGKMGSAVVKAVSQDSTLKLVGAIDNNNIGTDAGVIAGIGNIGLNIVQATDPLKDSDVVVDFTSPSVVEQNILTALEYANHVVVGTTGLNNEALGRIKEKSAQAGKNVFIAPNFAIGAILMMELAKRASKHMDNAEIIEYHHNQKLDAPSGTSLKTADELAAKSVNIDGETEIVKGSRGGLHNGIRVHSVRLPGLVAHQEVIFGAAGQTLTIRHDSIDRVSFMPGVIAAVKAVSGLNGLTIGLEKILDV